MTFDEKLQRFAQLLERETFEARELGSNLHPECTVYVKPGRKYTRVDVGTSGKYMVVNETGEIFGIKAYGVIHCGHPYGTLNTIDNWFWGGYTAERRPATYTPPASGEGAMIERDAAIEMGCEDYLMQPENCRETNNPT